ncbi:MAG: M23 family metallopeptidase [Bacteroidales bacterium]
MAKEKDPGKKKWYYRLRDKYRLVIMNEETYEKKLSFRLSRLNVFVTITTISLLMIVLTIFIIAFTPLREYIPGYMDPSIPAKVYHLSLKADSLEKHLALKDHYIRNIRRIISGEEIHEEIHTEGPENVNYDTITLRPSREDSILRAEYDRQNRFTLLYQNYEESYRFTGPERDILFFPPVKGIITNHFDLGSGHYGIDIVAKKGEPVNAILDGTVIISEWTAETGYVIGIQHHNNFISLYKHNSVLLKKQGNTVKSGEPVAIIGGSGELSSGPHLHFELWSDGTPVNPVEYISFE